MITPVPLDDVDAMLKRLHLPTIRRLYGDRALRAEQEELSDFLELLCAEDIAHRAQTRVTRLVQRARFPILRTTEESRYRRRRGERAVSSGQPAPSLSWFLSKLLSPPG